MARIFKAAAVTGAFLIVDEFTNLTSTVMTAMSQMIEALRFASQNQATSITIENESFNLKAGTAFFATYNPGLAGKTEIPQAVKTHFRSIAFVRPDYEIIFENMAASHGYCLKDIPQVVALASLQTTNNGLREAKAVFMKSWGNFKLSASGRMNRGIISSNLDWFMGEKYNFSMVPLESYYLGVALVDPNEGDLY